jgi:SAM-dependent methyltransferase
MPGRWTTADSSRFQRRSDPVLGPVPDMPTWLTVKQPAARFRADTYGESFAEVYDEWYHDVSDAAAVARFVAARCGAGPVLELGVGTGRLAAPLVAVGLTAIGLDASAAMLARCRLRPEAAAVHLVRADMAALPFGRPVGAVLIGFNTLFNLGEERTQRSLFRQVAALLAADGILVVEANQVEVLAGGPERWVGPSAVSDHGVTVVATEINRANQTMVGQHVEVTSAGVRFRPWRLRWSTTAQIDEFATAAGLRQAERHGGWSGEPFAPGGDAHVSVYRPI